jgi:hypothetical protein
MDREREKMKNRILLFLMLVFAFVSIPVVMASEDIVMMDPVTVPPEWLQGALIWLKSMPYVGPVLAEIFKWVGVVASIMTALSYTAQIILALPEVVARFAGAPALAEKIKFWSDKILYC